MIYVIYTNYGKGITYRTGPVELRHRVGLWAHFEGRHEVPTIIIMHGGTHDRKDPV